MKILFAIGGAVLVAAPVQLPAQDEVASLQRAQLIERQEGDLPQAAAEYRRLAAGEGAVGTEAALQLGELLWRLDRRDEARPFLERAAAAGGDLAARAAAVLQGQDPAGQQAQELAAKARELVDQAARGGQVLEPLRWLGAPGVQALAQRIEARRESILATRTQLEAYHLTLGAALESGLPWVTELRVQVALLQLLWQLGGDQERDWLLAAAGDADVYWRQLVAAGAQHVPIAASLLPVVERMLRDDDPSGYVPDVLLGAARQLPVRSLLPLLEDTRGTVREHAWQALGASSRWGTMDAAATGQELAAILPPLRRVLRGTDPAAARAAFAFLLGIGVRAAAGTELLFEWLPHGPGIEGELQAAPLEGSLAALVACAKALGPVDEGDGRNGSRRFLAQRVWQLHHPERPAPLLLDLVELGFDRWFMQESMALDIARTGEAADLERLATLLGRCHAPGSLAHVLTGRDLPATLLPGLIARLREILPALPAAQTDQRSQLLWQEAADLLGAIARTGNPEAMPFLREVSTHAQIGPPALTAARSLHRRNPTADGGAFLRAALVDPVVRPQDRNELFACLVRVGDEAAIALLPRAYELGLEATADRSDQRRRGVQFLASEISRIERDGHRELVPLHGYRPEQVEAAVRELLRGGVAAAVLADMISADLQFDGAVRTLALEYIADRADELADNGQVQALVAQFVRSLPGDDSPAARAERRPIARLLGLPAFAAAAIVEAPSAHWFASELRQMLGGRNGAGALRALARGGVDVPAAEILAGLAVTRSRYAYLGAIPDTAGPEVVRAVAAFLGDADATLRELACKRLGSMLAMDATAELLAALRDPVEKVRTAAAEALQRIRLYHEQKGYWDRVQTGFDTRREVVATKLLGQARPDQEKAQRLLALQSLGALGAPEALPYLIEWSADADAEVAAAVRAAITAIQGKAK